MANRENIESNLNEAFNIVRDNMIQSFEHINDNPKDTNEVIAVWKSFSNKLMKEFFTLSEKYDNKDIAKAIGKMIMFGR